MQRGNGRRAGGQLIQQNATMSFYRDHVYPHLVNALGDPERMRDIRREIVLQAQGTVLEIGVGPGPNFAHYDPARVCKVYALEPNPGMVRLAQRRCLKTKLDVEFLRLPGERIPLDDGSVDTVVSTFTLCTIPAVLEALREVRRVLRSGGTFRFFEHGLSPDARVQRWQRRTEPIPHWLFEGCHVTRDIPSLITRSGFKIEDVEARHLASFPKSWSYCWWGAAVPE